MRVAVEKVKGVDSVEVNLKRGVAHIRLVEGNGVTLARIRQVIKDAGYVSHDATVTVIGTVESSGARPAFIVAGTKERFGLRSDPTAPAALDSAVKMTAGLPVELTGVVPVTDPSGKGTQVIRVQSVR